jgi:hypothetical protein
MDPFRDPLWVDIFTFLRMLLLGNEAPSDFMILFLSVFGFKSNVYFQWVGLDTHFCWERTQI